MLKIISIVIKLKEYIFLIQDILNKIEKYIPTGTQINFIVKLQDYIDKAQAGLDIIQKYLEFIPTSLSEEELPEDIKIMIEKFEKM